MDDDESDSYSYRPVTAIFTHVSDQVYNIDFDNGESVGVTFQHLIYSVTARDWRLAGDLEVGEEVLNKTGEATVICSEWQKESETVYNLEIKELHNFLVGGIGIVVHTSIANRTYRSIRNDNAFRYGYSSSYRYGFGSPFGFRRGYRFRGGFCY